MKKCEYARRCQYGNYLNPEYCGYDDNLTDENECPQNTEMLELLEIYLNEENKERGVVDEIYFKGRTE